MRHHDVHHVNRDIHPRAARVGFDWPDISGPRAKILEELDEIDGAATAEEREAELGDLLFAVVNLCRKAGVHASIALDKANAKFERRFQRIEQLAAARGIDVKTAGLERLDALWDEAKREEPAR